MEAGGECSEKGDGGGWSWGGHTGLGNMLLNRDWAQSGSALGWLTVCGFSASCRKDFTIQVHVILRVGLVELGTVKQKKGFR